MGKLASLLLAFFALILIIGTIGYVVAAGTSTHSSAPVPAATPATTPPELIPNTTAAPPATPSPISTPELAPTSESTTTLMPITSPAPVSVPTEWQEPAGQNIYVYQGVQPPYARTSGSYDRIQLVDNENAADPTWEQLRAFLLADKTDEEYYIPLLNVCGTFAEGLHNNAEAAGIRAAWVSVDFGDSSSGHALNAFETVDKGLVYVDVTGGTTDQSIGKTQAEAGSELSGKPKVYGEADNWDKVAYIVTGREYGLLSYAVASCPQYVCYENHKQRKLDFEAALNDYNQQVRDYNSEIEEFNAWVRDKVFFIGTSDAERMKSWRDQLVKEKEKLDVLSDTLDKEGRSLGAFWEPLGTVSKVEIYW